MTIKTENLQMTTDIERLNLHHRNLHNFYVKVATGWPHSDPQRLPTLELISAVLELIETQQRLARN